MILAYQRECNNMKVKPVTKLMEQLEVHTLYMYIHVHVHIHDIAIPINENQSKWRCKHSRQFADFKKKLNRDSNLRLQFTWLVF